MSQGLNKVLLIGNLGLDPELRYTQNGSAVLRLRLATTERWKGQDGQRQERTEWHTVVMFGKRADALNPHLSKGQTVYIEGRIQTRKWQDKDGSDRYSTEVVANDLLFLGGGGERSSSGGAQRGSGYGGQGQGYGGSTPPGDDFGDDDIPF